LRSLGESTDSTSFARLDLEPHTPPGSVRGFLRPLLALGAASLAFLPAAPPHAQQCSPDFDDLCLIEPTAAGEDVSPYCFLPTLSRGLGDTNYATTASEGDGTCHDFVTYLRFVLPADLLGPAEVVTQASLLVPYAFNSTFGSVPPHSPVRLRVHRVTGPWSEATVTWVNQPPFDPVWLDEVDGIVDYTTLEFDVAAAVASWASGAQPNYGFVLTSPDEEVLGFYSWEAPVSAALKPALAIVTGACVDADLDGLCDAQDLCPHWPDAAAQSDRDGNGIGDGCECGDQNGDGTVNVQDLIAINLALFDPSRITPLCDATGDGACTVADIVGANQKIFGRPAYCTRYPAPR
jgi:hypothetical protein